MFFLWCIIGSLELKFKTHGGGVVVVSLGEELQLCFFLNIINYLF